VHSDSTGDLHGVCMGEHAPQPVWLGLLGSFRLLRWGEPLAVRAGGKTEALLGHLGLASMQGVPRALLLSLVWPDSEAGLAANAFNNVVHNLRGQLGAALGGASPVVQTGGYCRLNREAGIGVDVVEFTALAGEAQRQARLGDTPAAANLAHRAIELYRGDLHSDADGTPSAILERDRLRATCLSMLMLLADDAFARADLSGCLSYALQLLAHDPCREDAHRLVMRCYLRRGERAQALRHYTTVKKILRVEFDAEPEPTTTALYEQMRLRPSTV